MNNNRNLILILYILVLIGCRNEGNVLINSYEMKTVNSNHLEALYNCPDTRFTMDINLKDTFTLIRDQQSFDKLVTGNCKPSIDFNSYNLIIGKKILFSGNESIQYDLKESLDKKSLNINVIFFQNITSVISNITYHVLIPKHYNIENTFLKTTVK